ncbi:hypothetical protein KAW64_06100 [bacterium]|nr:hypothetical protein [bacterium]
MRRVEVGRWLYLENLEPGAKAKLNEMARALVADQLEQARALQAEVGWDGLTDGHTALLLLAVDADARQGGNDD